MNEFPDWLASTLASDATEGGASFLPGSVRSSQMHELSVLPSLP
jgi:hypothetical protein